MGFVAPLAGIGLSVIIMIVAPQEPQKTTIAYLVASAILISIGLISSIRTAIIGFDFLAWDTVSERIEVSRLLKPKRSFAVKDIMGYSAFYVTRVGSGVVVYVADGSHIELTDFTHPYLKRFVQLLHDRKVRYLGAEACSIKRMFGYRYD